MSDSSAEKRVPPGRRRQKLIRRDLQLRVIYSTLFVSMLILIFNYQVPLFGVWYLRQTSEIFDPATVSSFSNLLLVSFGISAVLTVPLALWMGVVQSFSFSGPIYKFKKHFQDLCQGRWDRPCHLRKKDDLKDVNEVFNQFTSTVCDHLREERALLESVRAYLEDAGNPEHPDHQDLVLRLEEATRKVDFRLGSVSEETERAEEVAAAEERPVEAPATAG